MNIELMAGAMVTGAIWFMLTGNLMERWFQATARLAAPCVDHHKLVPSILCVSTAGAYLLVNEVLIARQERNAGWLLTIAVFIFAALWSLAAGILTLELLWQITHL